MRQADAGESLSRKSFLKYLSWAGLSALAAAVLYPIASFLIPPKVKEVAAGTVVAAKVGELTPNSGKIFNYGGKPAILISLPGSGKYRAFTAVCTHLACTVQFRPDFGHIWCACHDGHYDNNGQVIKGPPPRPLEEFTVTVRGENIMVSRPA